MLPIKQIAANFPEWTLGQCRAYRAGALSGLRRKPITEGMIYDESDEHDEDDFTVHYLRGYADATGPEAESSDWFDEISDWRIQEKWWDILY